MDTKFQPGQSGNPKGRPKGTRNRISQAVIDELCSHFEAHGAEAIEKVFQINPAAYLKICASFIPKGFEISEVDTFGDISDEELDTSLLANTENLLRDRTFQLQLLERGITISCEEIR